MKRFVVVLLSAVSLSLTLAACGSGTSSSGTGSTAGSASRKSLTPLSVACAASPQHLPRQVAVDEGYFTDEGLNVSCTNVTSGPDEDAALFSGQLDVAPFTAANITPLLAKGQQLVVFGATWNANYWDIVVRKGYPLPDKSKGWRGVMQDLAHAKIGVVALGAAAQYMVEGMFSEAGVNPNSATYIATGLPTTTVAALKAGTIDAALTFEPGITVAVQDGIATQPFSLAAGTGPKNMVWSDLLLVSSRSYATAHRALLCRFATAWNKGLAYVRNPKNRSSVVKIAESLMGLPSSIASVLVQRDMPYFPSTVFVTANQIEPAFNFLYQYHLAPQDYPFSSYYMKVC